MTYIPAFAAGDVLTAANMNSIGDAWSSYGTAASFTCATGANPALGTGGSWSAFYGQINKLVMVRGKITWGSTGLSLGGGAYRIALPVTAKSSSAGTVVGVANLYDNGGQAFPARLLLPSTTTVAIYYTAYAAGAIISSELTYNNAPLTFGNTDWIDFNFYYEAA